MISNFGKVTMCRNCPSGPYQVFHKKLLKMISFLGPFRTKNPVTRAWATIFENSKVKKDIMKKMFCAERTFFRFLGKFSVQNFFGFFCDFCKFWGGLIYQNSILVPFTARTGPKVSEGGSFQS